MNVTDWVEENVGWPIERALRDIRNIPRKIKWRWQRSKRGYADCDLWNAGDYITDQLENCVREFQKHRAGCGGVPTRYFSYKVGRTQKFRTMEEANEAFDADMNEILENLRIWREIKHDYEWNKYHDDIDAAWRMADVAYRKAVGKFIEIQGCLWC